MEEDTTDAGGNVDVEVVVVVEVVLMVVSTSASTSALVVTIEEEAAAVVFILPCLYLTPHRLHKLAFPEGPFLHMGVAVAPQNSQDFVSTITPAPSNFADEEGIAVGTDTGAEDGFDFDLGVALGFAGTPEDAGVDTGFGLDFGFCLDLLLEAVAALCICGVVLECFDFFFEGIN